MSEPFIGEIRPVGFNFAPVGWAFCDGALLDILQNETLFNLIGTIYGGDGETTFALPDLRGRLPLHQGDGYVVGETAGVESVTLTTSQLPAHTHTLQASSDQANTRNPRNALPAPPRHDFAFATPAATAPMDAAAIALAGGNQPHSNLQPYLCVTFVISLFGIYPSQ